MRVGVSSLVAGVVMAVVVTVAVTSFVGNTFEALVSQLVAF